MVLDMIRYLYLEEFLSDFIYCLTCLLTWKNLIFIGSIWNTIIFIFFSLKAEIQKGGNKVAWPLYQAVFCRTDTKNYSSAQKVK